MVGVVVGENDEREPIARFLLQILHAVVDGAYVRRMNTAIDQDVRGDNGRMAIPRGARAELIVRVARDNDLILDLESVIVNGQRYGIRTEANRVESRPDVPSTPCGDWAR